MPLQLDKIQIQLHATRLDVQEVEFADTQIIASFTVGGCSQKSKPQLFARELRWDQMFSFSVIEAGDNIHHSDNKASCNALRTAWQL
jgi:hypothetical protein